MRCYKCRIGNKHDDSPPCLNWPIILSLQLLLSIAFSVFTPSIYQFITTPRSLPQEQQNNEEDSGKFWPGLGESESFYAWVLMARYLGELISVPVVGYMTENLPYIVSISFVGLFFAIGGLLYALTTDIWMMIVANIFIGFGFSSAVIVHTYIGEIGIKMDEGRTRKKQKPAKFGLYIAFSFILNGGYFVTFIMTSVMSQFPNIDPYRWPGWCLTVITTIYILITVIMFRNPRKCTAPKCFNSCTQLKFSVQLKSKWHIRLLAYSFLILSGYVIGQVYSIYFTLVTPVLSDKFGFDVANTSHFLVGTSVIFLGSSFILLAIKLAKVNDRLLLGVTFILGLAGVILFGDWQGIGRDPCSSANIINHFNISTDNYIHSQSGMFSADSVLNAGGDSIASPDDYFLSLVPLPDETNSSNSSLHSQWVESCKALSSSSHQCFWNPKSRITGELCNTCDTVCYSEQKSFNFIQFSAGVMLICLSSALGFVFISSITSAYTPVDHQGTMLSLSLVSGTTARLVSPLWFVKMYELSGKHTYVPMSINVGCLIVLLLLLAAFYKELTPKSNTGETHYKFHLTAPSVTLEKEIEYKGKYFNGEHSSLESPISVATFSTISRTNDFVIPDQAI